jgi:uncharacterized protein YegP (UPF0339 family)
MTEPLHNAEEDRPDRVEIFSDVVGAYRWRRVAPNGEPLSGSLEGFTRRADAVKAAQRANDQSVKIIYSVPDSRPE